MGKFNSFTDCFFSLGGEFKLSNYVVMKIMSNFVSALPFPIKYAFLLIGATVITKSMRY